MTTEEILKQSTPRPWKAEHWVVRGHGPGEGWNVIAPAVQNAIPAYSKHGACSEADANLVEIAVNSYEADQALIKQLVEALEATNRANELEIDGHPLADSQIVHAHKLRDAALAAAKEHKP